MDEERAGDFPALSIIAGYFLMNEDKPHRLASTIQRTMARSLLVTDDLIRRAF